MNKKTSPLFLPLVAGILALALMGWGYFWFKDIVIPEPKEIIIDMPHRNTHPVELQLARCRNKGMVTNETIACINEVFDVG